MAQPPSPAGSRVGQQDSGVTLLPLAFVPGGSGDAFPLPRPKVRQMNGVPAYPLHHPGLLLRR